MEKRYQVFVSSTYADLKDERQKIIQALMEMDCIPAGMELFPAADEDQFAFIKRIIDDCDYYILMIGGRYGSVTSTGLSYTEQECDYAISRDLKVVALLHERPDDIPMGKSEKDPALRDALQRFREKVSAGRLVRFWKSAEELPGIVALSMSKTIRTYPAVGWVRADRVSNERVLSELNEVRKRNDELAAELAAERISQPARIANLASLDEPFDLSGSFYYGSERREWKTKMTWREMFAAISPYLMQPPNASTVKAHLSEVAFKRSRRDGRSPSLDDQEFQTISVQLRALGLVNIKYLKNTAGGMGLFWFATREGDRLMLELRTVRSGNPGGG